MQPADLRPLSLGELLDRTFTLYRSRFLLFFGISAIPHIAVLALNLARFLYLPGLSLSQLPDQRSAAVPELSDIATWGILTMAVVVVSVAVAVVASGGTIIAAAENYLGRTITIGDALQRAVRAFFRLLGVSVVVGVVVVIGFFFLIIPGIYLACRLLVSMPTTVMEGLMPRQTLERSFALTSENAGRSFLILLMYFVLAATASALLYGPFFVLTMLSRHNPEIAMVWLALGLVGQTISTVLVSPVLYISAALFYFDLRIRKEAFDLQLMMSNASESASSPVAPQPNFLT
jgi:hypothetical protein